MTKVHPRWWPSPSLDNGGGFHPLHFVFSLPHRTSIPRPHSLRPCRGDSIFTFLLPRVLRSGCERPARRVRGTSKFRHCFGLLLEHQHFHIFATLLYSWRLLTPHPWPRARGCLIIRHLGLGCPTSRRTRCAALRSAFPPTTCGRQVL